MNGRTTSDILTDENFWRDLREQYLLREDIRFLNHGSFGACPRRVLDRLHALQREMETHPHDFIDEKYFERLPKARAALEQFIGATSGSTVFVPNATTGANIVARSLNLTKGMEVLVTNHEYPGIKRIWRYLCEKTESRYIEVPLPHPFIDKQAIVDAIFDRVTAWTQILTVSHITATTGVILPIKEICKRAHDRGIRVLVDGAHVPGMMPLNVQELGADYYVGNGHKWLGAPKGTGFLHVRPDRHDEMEPLVVSWGWDPDEEWESPFLDLYTWMGTRDPSPFLAMSEAFAFQEEIGRERILERGHALCQFARQELLKIPGTRAVSPDDPDWYGCMVAVELPSLDVSRVRERLFNEFKLETKIHDLLGVPILRVSAAPYTRVEDIEALVEALSTILGS